MTAPPGQPVRLRRTASALTITHVLKRAGFSPEGRRVFTRSDRDTLARRFIAEAELSVAGCETYAEASTALRAYLDTLKPYLRHQPDPGDLQGLKADGWHFLTPSRKLRLVASAIFYPYFRAWLRRAGHNPAAIEGQGWWAAKRGLCGCDADCKQ